MEALRGTLLPRRLTKMYAETKKTYENVTKAEKMQTTPVSSHLHRKLRIQKDRLITWGLDWSDASVGQPADIDDALDRAGLSEIVASVMSCIQELLDEAEEIRSSHQPKGLGILSTAKGSKNTASEDHIVDKPRFEDLLKDLTSSIDTLFDLSRSRRGFGQKASSQAINTETTSRSSAEARHTSRAVELPNYEGEISSWSPSPSGHSHKSSTPVDYVDFEALGRIAPKAGSSHSLPPPYEAISSNPAAAVNLGTLLQLTADTARATVPNLEDRLRLAFNLASSLNRLHKTGLVHGDVNSGNVVFCRSTEITSRDFFCGWRGYDIRNANFSPTGHPERSPAPGNAELSSSSIYHHPQIRNISSIAHKQAYDVYSLGLVLLEIGFWMPLSAFWKMKYSQEIFKSRLENVYVRKLAAKCGSTYMRTVQHCLTSADMLFVTRTLPDVNSSDIQSNFCAKVVEPLERCCVLDDPDISTSSEISPLPRHPETESTKTSNIPSAPHGTAMGQTQPKYSMKRRHKIWSVSPPKSVLGEWNNILLPRLDRIVHKVLKNSLESFSADLMMVGDTAVTSRPTIVITCTSVREIKTAVHRYLKRDREIYDLKVRKGEIAWSKVSRKKRRQVARRSARSSDSESSNDQQAAINPFYQQQPACGASIGAFRDNEHLPAVSFGGVILLDDEPYGMTVHHMLEQSSVDGEGCSEEDDDEHPAWSSDTTCRNLDTFPASSFYAEDTPQVQYPFEISDDDDDGYSSAADDDDGSWLLEEPDNDNETDLDDDNVSLGDTPGVDPDENNSGEYIITQPAIDDVDDDFFPIEEDRDEEHLESHFLGNIHASSGIRRWKRDGIKHEIDWALIKFSEHRVQHHNIVRGGRLYCRKKDSDGSGDEDFYPHKVAAMDELAGLEVHSLGRTSGLQGGTISSAMSLVKFPGRNSSSLSWHVVGNFGGKLGNIDLITAGGDSGAWVIDNHHGRVCGHVLAWCSKNCVAYIAPMQVMLEDIAQALGTSQITLPYPRGITTTKSLPHENRQNLIQTSAAMAIEKPLPPLPLDKDPLNSTETSLSTLAGSDSVKVSDLTDCMHELQGLAEGHVNLGSEELPDLGTLHIEGPPLMVFPDTTHLHDIPTSYRSKSGMIVEEHRMSRRLTQC
ncbi:MAG: hypothetical protein M1830_005198 [Pleopsidium flavum]|nr:MAG: hypothetical protein M1830_005198 [Pleopsidium flavum]